MAGNTFLVGAFGPVLPEIARTRGLADWQLGVVAGAFGFARMAGAAPAGILAGRHVALSLVLSPLFLAAGLLCLVVAPSFSLLVVGRALMGIGHTLLMVGGITAILQDDGGSKGSFRLNVFEFSGMLGILGGLALMGVLPAHWPWNLSLPVAAAPLLIGPLLGRALMRRFPPTPAAAPAGRGAVTPSRTAALRGEPVFWLMLAVGMLMALAWSSVSQFLIPLRGTREFGLGRSGVSILLALAQIVDLIVLLPVGWLADRVGRVPVLGAVLAVLALGTFGTGLGGFWLFVAGCACFGMGLAGWMLPLGIIREHAGLPGLAWRTGLYRVGMDSAVFLGPVLSGLLGERLAGYFVALVGAAVLVVAGRLTFRPLSRRVA
jgi:MFS family permease